MDEEKLPTSTVALYEDKYVKVCKGNVIIKCYYFPLGTNKEIESEKIHGVYYEEQKFLGQCFRTKTWGMSLTPCWWASDIRRGWHSNSDGFVYYNVVFSCAEKTYKGFTVVDIEEFLTAIKLFLPSTVVIREKLPF